MSSKTNSMFSTSGDFLPVAVRCFTEKITSKKRSFKGRPRKVIPRPDRMLVLDTETATIETITKPQIMPGFNPERWSPEAQALLFGRAHLYKRKEDGQWKKVYEWLFYPDDLPEKALRKLERRFRRMTYRMGDWREPRDEPRVKCYLMPLSEWIKVFYWEAVAEDCLIVGFNLPFDLSRIACHVGAAKTRWFAGGFSFIIWPDPTGKRNWSLFRPRIQIRKLGEKTTAIDFGPYKLGPEKKARRIKPGSEFLDLSQLVKALTGEPHSLDSACRAFGLNASKHKIREHGDITLKYLLYNRQDVEITFQLAMAALKEFDRHPISRCHFPPGHLSEAKVFSSASIAKAYLKQMGITPRLKAQPDFPKNILGCAMEAYYGGRVDTKIRLNSSPVVYLDYLSMYPTINVLMGLWLFIIAEKIEIVEDTEDAISFLDRVTHNDLFDRALWLEELSRLVLIEPDGDILSVRARYNTSNNNWKIGLNPYHSDESQWCAMGDVVASKLLTGKSPRILKSVRLIPVGVQKNLQPVDFRGIVRIDPSKDDFFKKVIEERAKVKAAKPPYQDLSNDERNALTLALKIIANAGSYGIFAEVNRNRLPTRKSVIQKLWHGSDDAVDIDTARPEVPGGSSFSPLASFIAAGARLMLAILERCVMDLGGTYAFCDTDSMAVIASEDGGQLEIVGRGSDGAPYLQQVRVLSWKEAREITTRFEALNIYDRSTVPGSILELKEENFSNRDLSGEQVQLLAYCIAPKRYCLFTEYVSHREIVSRMESALGSLRPPVEGDWITKWWEAILDHGKVPYSNLPLVRRFTISNWDILRRFRKMNRGKAYQAQIKPFNFFLATSADPLMYQGSISSLLAPYEPDPRKWENLSWLDYRTGQEHHITTQLHIAMAKENERTGVVTFGSYFTRYRQHPCREFLGPDGKPCGRKTRDLLGRRPIRRLNTYLIGKETNVLTMVEVGLELSVTLEVGRNTGHWFDILRSILRDIKTSEIAQQLGVSERTVQMWKAGMRKASSQYKLQLESICIGQVRKVFKDLNLPIPDHPTNALQAYKQLFEKC